MSGPDHRAWIEVDLSAVVENARTVARTTGARLLPVVKANAYGVGAVAVSGALETADPWGYALATVDEATELRRAGIGRPLLVLTPARADEFVALTTHGLRPVLDDPDVIRAWGARGPFHLEVDTGMGRSGIRWDRVAAVREVLDTPHLEGVFTQFHSADVAGDDTTDAQLERFRAALRELPRKPALRHVANSAAAMRDRKYALDLVRPGIFLLGGEPGAGLAAGRPVVSMRARVVSVRRVAGGDTVSYGARWAAPRETTIATLAIGYPDGPRRRLGLDAGAYVLLNGRRCPIAGVVTMDFTMVDAGDAQVRVGDVATLLGEADGDRITLAQLVGWSGDVQHAVLTSLGARPPRIYT
jgi:alanine racemase